MIEPLREVVLPLFLTLGIVLRILGAAAFGAVIGTVLKNIVEREETTKYLLPVAIIATSLIFAFVGTSRGSNLGGLDVGVPGSPGTLGAFGLGVALAYFVMGRNREA